MKNPVNNVKKLDNDHIAKLIRSKPTLDSMDSVAGLESDIQFDSIFGPSEAYTDSQCVRGGNESNSEVCHQAGQAQKPNKRPLIPTGQHSGVTVSKFELPGPQFNSMVSCETQAE